MYTPTGKAGPARYKSDPKGREDTTFLLEWSAMSFSPVTEFIIEHRAEGESWSVNSVTPTKEVNVAYHFAGKIYLKNLKPATRYEARSKAKNDEGWSNPSDIFNFATRGTGRGNSFRAGYGEFLVYSLYSAC